MQMKSQIQNTIHTFKESGQKDLLFLSLEDVITCGGNDVEMAAGEIEQGFKLLASNRIFQPFKTTLKSKNLKENKHEGLVNILPAHIQHTDDLEIFGCKALGAMPSNVMIGVPRATGLILLFDSETKTPVCVMDAQVISATRTGAVTLLAARKLANLETEEIGLVGAGVNMRTQLLALNKALPKLKKVFVYSRGQSKFDFAEKMGLLTGKEIIPVNSAEEAVKDKRLTVTCLPNILSPVVKADWIREKGVTCINIGCYETEAVLLKRMDRVVADIWAQGKHRGVQTHAQAVKEGHIDESKIEDLAPIINGDTPGRKDDTQNIFFAPTGLGFEDLLVAWRVYQSAAANNIGTYINLWNNHRWI